MQATIVVQKAEAYTELSKLTAYEASRAGMYDTARTTDGDNILLEFFWAQACATITGELRQFLVNMGTVNTEPDTVEAEADFTALLNLSASFPPAMLTPLGINVRMWFIYYMAAEWFRINLPEKAEAYKAMAIDQLGEVRQKVFFKAPPRRSKPWETTDDDETTTDDDETSTDE